MDQSSFLTTDQPAEGGVERQNGEVVFETSVAFRSGIMHIEVRRDIAGPVLVLTASGGSRRSSPIVFDQWQAVALRAALMGAAAREEIE